MHTSLGKQIIRLKDMNFTQSIGNVTELKCISKFIELGYEVSIPYGNGARYDFIADVNGELLKIQCKSSSAVDEDAFSFKTTSTTTNTIKTIRHNYTKQEIDYFATCWKDIVYLVPVEECSTAKTLRLKPPKNHNPNYNKAEDYEITKRILPNQELLLSKEDFNKRNIKNIKYCTLCNQKLNKDNSSGLCIDCYKQSISKEKPSREELKILIRTLPFTQIGEKYNVSDNAIRKWCDNYNLPRRVSDIKKYSEEEWKNI